MRTSFSTSSDVTSAHYHDPHRYGHLPLTSTGNVALLPPPISALHYERQQSLSKFLQNTYFEGKSTLMTGSDSSLCVPPPRGIFVVKFDVPLGDEGHFLSLEETFDYESHPPPDIPNYVARLKSEYGLSPGETAKIHASIITQVNFKYFLPPVSWGHRIQPKVWRGNGVYKDEYNTVKGMLSARDDAAARAFALEVQELNQVEMSESGPVVLANRNKQQQNGNVAFGGYKPSAAERTEVKRRYDLIVPVRKPTFFTNLHCHLCHATKKGVECLKFGPCNHAFCTTHCLQKYGLTAKDIKVSKVDLKCPVCAVTCNCKECERRIEKLCFDMVRHRTSDKQTLYQIDWTPPPPVTRQTTANTNNQKRENPYASTTTRGERRSGSTSKRRRDSRTSSKASANTEAATRKSGRSKKNQAYSSVYDDPDSDGVDLEPGGPLGPNSQQKPKPTAPKIDTAKLDLEEDGNTDFCMKCKLGGGLLCCDFCPRAFHPKCIKVDEETLPDGDWVCPKCALDTEFVAEDDTLPEPRHEGSETKKMIDQLRALTVHLSTKVDFGYAFKEPVNTKVLKDYHRVVENPMSYDEIIADIDKGVYMEGGNLKKPNKIFSKILIDINTVFQNCYRYNNEGSAIFRMAEVHEKNFLKLVEGNKLKFGKAVMKDLKKFIKFQKEERKVYLRLCKRRQWLHRRPLTSLRKIANYMYFRECSDGNAKVMDYCNSEEWPPVPGSPVKKSPGKASRSPDRKTPDKKTPGTSPPSNKKHGASNPNSKRAAVGRRCALVDCKTGEFLDTYPNLSMMLSRMKFYDKDGQKIEGSQTFNPNKSDGRRIWEVYLSKESMLNRSKPKMFKGFWVTLNSIKFVYQDVCFLELDDVWTDGGGHEESGEFVNESESDDEEDAMELDGQEEEKRNGEDGMGEDADEDDDAGSEYSNDLMV
eukprot:CAMPEP_0118659170 /NCGR_PEP_ID=MMETSP0785-20121206/14966_1 /TAXON_ID=91992 /ORGANISM="Bolidomonas pacifica, Strain CCMP 1866" /LENGTH=926 /DNA_ID=CAMNT_0006552251 /DNA_START=121 /DNA_END=2898 /DNA_ORIENTATION=-